MLRFENEFGYGPFRGNKHLHLLKGHEQFIITEYIRQHVNFPTPYEEGLDMMTSNLDGEKIIYYCAYKDEDRLKQFCILEQYKALIKLGFKLYKIEATQIQYGNYQNVFAKESIVSKVDITDEFLLNY